MPAKNKKPQWWQLYLTLPLLAGLFLLEMRLPFTSTEHIIAQLGILWLIYASVQVWIKANRRALMGLDEEPDERQGEWRIRVLEFPADGLAREASARATPLLHLPEAGLKGVLSTTFEIDDSESNAGIPVDSEALYSHEARRNERRQGRRESDHATAIPEFVRKE